MTEKDALKTLLKHPVAGKVLRGAGSVEEVPPDEPLTVLAGPWPSEIDDAEPRICSGCQSTVGISPSTVQMQWTRTKLRFLCFDCLVREQP